MKDDTSLPGDFTSRICFVAAWAREHGYADVSTWMQRCLSVDTRAARGTRKRGVHVRLGNARGPKAFLDAARVKELAEQEENHNAI